MGAFLAAAYLAGSIPQPISLGFGLIEVDFTVFSDVLFVISVSEDLFDELDYGHGELHPQPNVVTDSHYIISQMLDFTRGTGVSGFVAA